MKTRIKLISTSHLHIKDCLALNSHLLNSLNIVFQTIFPLEQKFHWRQQADKIHRKSEIIPLRCQKGPGIKLPSWNFSTTSSNHISLWAENWLKTSGNIETQKWLKSFHCRALYRHLGILQTSSSSKPYILQRRNLIEGFRQHGY